MRAMARPERVLHEDVPALGEASRAVGVVLRLARIEARVLEHLDALVREELA
jgi:hypothetical protein